MVLRCWQEDSVVLDGRYYKAPYPFETDVRKYPAVNIAREAGAPGEIDANGNVRRISVVPTPFQKPHPPVFVATSKSDDSVRYCGRHALFQRISPNSTVLFIKVKSMSKRLPRQASTFASASVRTSCVGCTSVIPRSIITANCENTMSTSIRTSMAPSFLNFRPIRTLTGLRISRNPGFTPAERSIKCDRIGSASTSMFPPSTSL
jgi:hypothetical protein